MANYTEEQLTLIEFGGSLLVVAFVSGMMVHFVIEMVVPTIIYYYRKWHYKRIHFMFPCALNNCIWQQEHKKRERRQ